MSANHLETIKQLAQHLETIIEKIDGLEFCPVTWDDSYRLLRELETAVEQIDNLSEQLDDALLDDAFCADVQNKAIVENLGEADRCLIDFSMHFSKIYSALEEEGPREEYEVDYDYLSTQLQNAKQHLDQILN